MSSSKVVDIVQLRGQKAVDKAGLGPDAEIFIDGVVPDIFANALGRVAGWEETTRAIQRMLESVPRTEPKPGFFRAASLDVARKQKVAGATVEEHVTSVVDSAPRNLAGVKAWLKRWGMSSYTTGDVTLFTIDIGPLSEAERIFVRKGIVNWRQLIVADADDVRVEMFGHMGSFLAIFRVKKHDTRTWKF
ncbi:hypothetical protein BURKHO8Y_340017 [Burkholderia sp. 8Y]|uniref:hypothetical protein n=1 Tax=Burkholderia sp. 8Y TaxID=2653133 RepID=UPI0012F38845|nr:hypothetical protein [Burkholderia sp. 8Y]VXC77973.1 hypothetical protein BURKHO8Y_340017 [Burkholderia sp. 8Y]